MKSTLRTWHRWLGLTACVFFLLQAATGLVMAHGAWLTSVLTPEMRVDASRPVLRLDELVQILEAAEPHRRLERLVYSEEPGLALTARFYNSDGSDLRIVFIDPTTGKLISGGPLWRYPFEFAVAWHMTLATGKSATGNFVALVVHFVGGLMLAAMAVTGPIVWWPRSDAVLRSLKIRWRAPMTVQLRDWHILSGVLLALFLFVSGITAASIARQPGSSSLGKR